MLVCAPKKLVGKKTKKKIVKFSLIFYRKIKGKKLGSKLVPLSHPFSQKNTEQTVIALAPPSPNPNPNTP